MGDASADNIHETIQINETQAQAVQVKRKGERNPIDLQTKLEEVCGFAKTVPPCIKGQEGKYLNALLLNYQTWFKKSLGAKGTFDETAFRIEKLGRKREVRDYLEDLIFGRSNTNQLDQYESSSDSEDEFEQRTASLFFPDSSQTQENLPTLNLPTAPVTSKNISGPHSHATEVSTSLAPVVQNINESQNSQTNFDFFDDDDDDDNAALMDEALAIAERAEQALQMTN